MEQGTKDKLKEIKSRFRLRMNGTASKAMRDKGLQYGINWGISQPELKEMASEYGKDYALAVELWKENIRECKLLATMIMPKEEMQADLAELWLSEIKTTEMAEMAAFYLFQYIEGAKRLAFKWISSQKEIPQLCGYNVLSRIFMNGESLNDRDINEFIDQACAVLEGEGLLLKRAVTTSISRLYNSNTDYSQVIKSAFKKYNLDIF